MFRHKHKWKYVDYHDGPMRRFSKCGWSGAMYWFYVCRCGAFRISGFADHASLEGKLPECVRGLSHVAIGRYLMRHVPYRDRRKEPE